VPSKGFTPQHWGQLGAKTRAFWAPIWRSRETKATDSTGLLVGAVGIERTSCLIRLVPSMRCRHSPYPTETNGTHVRRSLPSAHRTRLQRLLLLLLTTNVSNKSRNLFFARSYPQCPENAGFLHSWCTVASAVPAGHNCRSSISQNPQNRTQLLRLKNANVATATVIKLPKVG
jgi:hypothetical protein